MKNQQVARMFCAGTLLIGLVSTANAAFLGRLPATPGGTDYQAYYDDQLDITWAADANINGPSAWYPPYALLDIGGVTGWRLPSVDVNADEILEFCSVSQTVCKDNEYAHLYHYGAGPTFGGGVTSSSPGPFSNIQTSTYWSDTQEILGYTDGGGEQAMTFSFLNGGTVDSYIIFGTQMSVWAVHSGDVGAVPVPAAIWLFGSGLLGLLGIAKRKKT